MVQSDGTVVDSEIYFHWIMANIKACNGNVLLGLHNATEPLLNWSSSRMNFIFSDGEALYGFRNYGGGSQYDYYLGYYDGLAIQNPNNFRAIRSQYYNDGENEGMSTIPAHALVYIPRDGDVVLYPNFDFDTFGTEVSGIVSGTWSASVKICK